MDEFNDNEMNSEEKEPTGFTPDSSEQTGETPVSGEPVQENETQQTNPNQSYSYYGSQGYNPSGNSTYGGNPYQANTSYYGPYNSAQPSGFPQPPKKKKRSGLKIILALVAIILVVSISIGIGAAIGNRGNNVTEEEKITSGDDTEIEAEKTPTKSASSGDVLSSVDIAKVARSSSVGILVYSENANYGYSSSSSSSNNASGEGTGIVAKLSKDKQYTYILTCAHVISDSGIKVKVLLEDGTTYDASIVGYDVQTDVGVLKVKTNKLTSATFGDSSSLEVGEQIYAVGNPGGSEFFGSVTNGIVSAIGRSINNDIGYTMECIQHNAAINPGNSGGALLNEYGQVIGINSSKIASTEYEGMSFSIPIKTALKVGNSLISNGYVPDRPMLGIKYSLATSYNTYAMIIQLKNLPSGSLIVRSVSNDSDLKNYDIQVGDLITSVNGKKLDTPDVLLDVINNGKVGDTIKLKICRVSTDYSVKEFEVSAKLVEDKGSLSDDEETTTTINPFDYFNQYGNQ